MTTIPAKEITKEFIFATYIKSNRGEDDILAVKEHLHFPDGSVKSNFRVLRNYERSFYITRKDLANHKDKREYEHLHNLVEHRTTQANMPRAIYKAINGFYPNANVNLYDLAESPYLYGSFITTPVLLAQEYKTRWPGIVSDYSLAVMDFETDCINGTGLIISGVISMRDKLHIAVTKDFLGPHATNAEEKIRATIVKYLGKFITERNITITVDIVKRPADVVISLFKRAHQWKPDVLGFWNISFDINKVIQALEVANINPAMVFSDPSVPDEFKYFKWNQANPVKVTASGKRSIKHNVDLLHTVSAPSSFYCLCLMFLFKKVRSQKEQQRNSYALDPTLKSELDLGKLNFESAADGLIKLDWHVEMQKNHKLEYMAYMAFDGIGVELLDEKTKDVARSFKGLTGISEIHKMASNPKRLSDDMHFILLADNKVSCTPSKDMTEAFDSLTPSKDGWIE